MRESQETEQSFEAASMAPVDVPSSETTTWVCQASKDQALLEQGVLAYKYSSPNLSFTERLFLESWWETVVLWYPTWLAPNLITLSGAMMEVIAYLLLWFYSPGLNGTAPGWVYIAVAVCHFLYQTLDGSDGKQARRTKSGSSMGEFFDHGVDALISVPFTTSVVDAMGMGMDIELVWVVLPLVHCAFFTSNMTLLHFGKQNFYDLDVMEIQWGSILVLAMTPFFPDMMWRQQISPQLDVFARSYPAVHQYLPLYGKDFISPVTLFSVLNIFGMSLNVTRYLVSILSMYLGFTEISAPAAKRKLGTGKKALLYQFAIITIHASTFYYSAIYIVRNISDATERTQLLRLILLIGCFCFADIMDRVLILRVTQYYNVVPLSLCVMSSLAFFCYRGSVSFDVIVLHLVLSIANHLGYFVSSVSMLSKILNVHPFKIKFKTE